MLGWVEYERSFIISSPGPTNYLGTDFLEQSDHNPEIVPL